MRTRQPLGLDELMIVNPGPSGSGALFLGEDDALYQVQGLGQFFLSEDGTLYQVQGVAEDESRALGRFFLGQDGTLYEVVR